MDISRNQYFMVGLIFLFLGIQFRVIESVQLTPEFTQILAERSGHPLAAVNGAPTTLSASAKPAFSKTVIPPEFVGWALMSLGATLILHSMAMRKPA